MAEKHTDTLDENYSRKSQIEALMPFCLNAPEQPALPVQAERKYTPVKNIDSGGMKRVEVIHDTVINRHIARAFLNEDKSWLQAKFLQEAKLTAQLDHPNIAPIYEIGQDEHGKPYFTMKWLQGETLAAILKKLKDGDETYLKKYQRGYLIDLFQRVCEAVAFAHSKGVAHLDLKPGNIMVSEFGEVYLIDWGLARYFTTPEKMPDYTVPENIPTMPEITHDGMVRGTPGYMSPEQADGKVARLNDKTDIYSLGAILYSILTYHVPVEGKEVKQILKDTIAAKIPSPRTRFPGLEIPESLEAITMKALRKEQENRYAAVSDLLSDITRYREGFATSAESAGSLKLLGLLIKRNRTFCLIAGSATGIIILLTVFFVVSLTRSERKAVQSANMLEQEVTKSRKLGYLASKQYLTQARDSFYQRYDFANSTPLAKMSVDLNPRNREAWIFYAFLELGRQNFSEAREAFRKAEYKDNPELIRLLDLNRQKEDPSSKYVVSLLQVLNSMQNKTAPSGEFLYFCMNVRRHMFPKATMTGLLETINKHTHQDGINISSTENSIRVELQPKASRIAWSILLLQVTDLKLVDSGSCIFLMPYMPYLQRLDLSNLPLPYLDANLFNNSYALYDINLDGTPLRTLNSSVLEDNLKKLSIRNCNLFDAGCLQAFNNLKQLIISADSPTARNQEIISALKRKGIEVIIQ